MTTGIDNSALYRLQSWLSPSFPVGAYTFSHGLEYAIEAGWVTSVASAKDWLETLLLVGTGQSDLVLLAEACDLDCNLPEIVELGLALATSRELRLESTAQGDAFVHAVSSAWPSQSATELQKLEAVPYPVAVGFTAAAHGIGRSAALHAYAHAFVANLISALVRAVPLGQTDGQRLLADLEPAVETAVARALDTPLAMIASSTCMSDIASMRHEQQYTRLFRS